MPKESIMLRLTLSFALCAVVVQAYQDDTYMHRDAYIPSSRTAPGGEVERSRSNSLYINSNFLLQNDNPRTSSIPHKIAQVKVTAAPQFWVDDAQADLRAKVSQDRQIGEAKNVIMFLGDGWGVPTVTLARILRGQDIDLVQFGEEGRLHVDTFPASGLSKTFCSNAQIADSACSATAYLCGVKGNIGTTGVTSNVKVNNCTAHNNQAEHVSSILAWAQAAGKSTGIVTTTRITHASPSGTYAHTANRAWECDTNIPILCNAELMDDIAEQLILNDPGRNINVILGGGRRKFLPNNFNDSEGSLGERLDGKNLVEEWIASKQGLQSQYVESREDLLAVDASQTDYLLGLFSTDHIAYYHEREEANDPTLMNMTQKAIEILSKNPNGFFLFVEGGRIDHAHHDNRGMASLWEAVEFDLTIETADTMTNDEDTLLVVTADHSHAVSFAGYSDRGSKLTEFGGFGLDSLPYSVISYANGPGFKPFTGEMRHDIREDDVESLAYQTVPLVPLVSETHGGEDVMIFAKGPFSHLFDGVHMQSYIPHAMAYASCVGSGPTYCNDG